jgi:chromosome segregation ATPase
VTALQAASTQSQSALSQVEARASQADMRVQAAEARAAAAEQRATELDAHAREVETRAREIETRASTIETKAKEAAERIAATDRRAREAESELEQLRAARPSGRMAAVDPTADRRLADAQAKIASLQREVDAAENVRQFAANTEREIAQLERELREMKAKLAQITLERDRLESQLRDVREDDETRTRNPEVTAQADMTRYTALVSRASDLERKLSDAEARLAAQQRAHDDDEEPTSTGASQPIEFAENLSVLEESIDSLRANMRAASDETAMMDQTDSVIAISAAVSSAAEHVERARDALRALAKMRPAG